MVATKKMRAMSPNSRAQSLKQISTDSIAHFPPVVRFFLTVAAALAVSGLGVIGLLVFEFYLFDAFGFIGFMAAMGIDALVIYGLVRHGQVNF